MKTILAAVALSVMAASAAAPSPAAAQNRDRDRDGDYRWQGDREDWDATRSYRRGNYRERRMNRDDRIYRGQDGRAYCRRNDGTTGLVVGGVGGAVLGNLVGGGLLGTLVGGGGGALLGRELDRGRVRCR